MSLNIQELQNKSNELIRELKRLVDDAISQTSDNSTYNKFCMVYPNFNAANILGNVSDSLSGAIKLLQIAEKMEEFARIDGLVTKYSSENKFIDLISKIDGQSDNRLIEDHSSKISEDIGVQDFKVLYTAKQNLKNELKELGFAKFNLIENSKNLKRNPQDIIKRGEQSDRKYYGELFEGIDNLDDALTAYCVNTDKHNAFLHGRMMIVLDILKRHGWTSSMSYNDLYDMLHEKYKLMIRKW